MGDTNAFVLNYMSSIFCRTWWYFFFKPKAEPVGTKLDFNPNVFFVFLFRPMFALLWPADLQANILENKSFCLI